MFLHDGEDDVCGQYSLVTLTFRRGDDVPGTTPFAAHSMECINRDFPRPSFGFVDRFFEAAAVEDSHLSDDCPARIGIVAVLRLGLIGVYRIENHGHQIAAVAPITRPVIFAGCLDKSDLTPVYLDVI